MAGMIDFGNVATGRTAWGHLVITNRGTGPLTVQSAGALTPQQVVVALVTLTLFIPCIASVTMIAKERGWRTAAGMLALVFPLAFLVGGLVKIALNVAGWSGL